MQNAAGRHKRAFSRCRMPFQPDFAAYGSKNRAERSVSGPDFAKNSLKTAPSGHACANLDRF